MVRHRTGPAKSAAAPPKPPRAATKTVGQGLFSSKFFPQVFSLSDADSLLADAPVPEAGDDDDDVQSQNDAEDTA